MKIEDYLCTQELRLNKGIGPERTLMGLTERHGLHEHLTESENAQTIQLLGDQVRCSLIEAFARLAMNPPDGVSKRQLQRWLDRLIRAKKTPHLSQKKLMGMHIPSLRASHAVESVAVGQDAIQDPVKNMHIHDVCGGDGRTSLIVSLLRKSAGRSTTATCWETDDKKQSTHLIYQRLLGQGNDEYEFLLEDIVKARLTRMPDRKTRTYVLGKHLCGSLTDTVLNAIIAQEQHSAPHEMRIMPCCHNKAKDIPPGFLEQKIATQKEWSNIVRFAGTYPLVQQYQNTVGLVARRVIDGLRFVNLPAGRGRTIQEVLPSDVSVQNRVIGFSNK